MAKQKSVYQIQPGDWVKYKKKEAVVVCEVRWSNGEKFIIELKEPIATARLSAQAGEQISVKTCEISLIAE